MTVVAVTSGEVSPRAMGAGRVRRVVLVVCTNALGTSEVGPPAGLARKDDAGARVASNADGTDRRRRKSAEAQSSERERDVRRDLGAVLSLSGRSASSARIKSLGSVQALEASSAVHAGGEISERREVVRDGHGVGGSASDGASRLVVGAERLGSRDLGLLGASALRGRRLDADVGADDVAGGAAGDGADRVLASADGAGGSEGADLADASAVGS